MAWGNYNYKPPRMVILRPHNATDECIKLAKLGREGRVGREQVRKRCGASLPPGVFRPFVDIIIADKYYTNIVKKHLGGRYGRKMHRKWSTGWMQWQE